MSNKIATQLVPTKKEVTGITTSITDNFLEYGLLGVVCIILIVFVILKDKLLGKALDSKYNNNHDDLINKLVDKIDETNKRENDNLKVHSQSFEEKVNQGFQDLKKEFNQNHDEMKDQINKNYIELKQEIADVYIVTMKQDESRLLHKKYLAILRKKLSETLVYFDDKHLKKFIVKSALLYIDWVIRSKDYMFLNKESFDLAIEEGKLEGDKTFEYCIEMFGEEFQCKFYKLQLIEYKNYQTKINKIFEDVINDKINKFVNTSLLYMQDFISNLVKVYMEDKPDYDVIYNEKIDGLDELKNIEKEN